MIRATRVKLIAGGARQGALAAGVSLVARQNGACRAEVARRAGEHWLFFWARRGGTEQCPGC